MPVLTAIWIASNKQEYVDGIGVEGKGIKKTQIPFKDISYIPIPGRVAVLKPLIDKVSLTYKTPSGDPALKPAVIEGLLLDAGDKENTQFKTAGQFQSGAVKYAASVKLIVPPNSEEVLVQAGP